MAPEPVLETKNDILPPPPGAGFESAAASGLAAGLPSALPVAPPLGPSEATAASEAGVPPAPPLPPGETLPPLPPRLLPPPPPAPGVSASGVPPVESAGLSAEPQLDKSNTSAKTPRSDDVLFTLSRLPFPLSTGDAARPAWKNSLPAEPPRP